MPLLASFKKYLEYDKAVGYCTQNWLSDGVIHGCARIIPGPNKSLTQNAFKKVNAQHPRVSPIAKDDLNAWIS